MKDKNTRAERFSNALSAIDDDLLEEAFRIDSAQKLRENCRKGRNTVGKIIAVAASVMVMAGVGSAVRHFYHMNRIQNSDSQASTTASSTVGLNNEAVRPIGAVINFDSVGEISDFLAAVKASPSEYEDYCKEWEGESVPFDIAEKIADSILSSEYHVRLKNGSAADGFTALYTDDGEGVLRLSFTVGETQYVFSHFYGVTSAEEHGGESLVGEYALGESAVPVFSAGEYFFFDILLGDTRIYAAAFTDSAEDIFSEFEIVSTSEAFAE